MENQKNNETYQLEYQEFIKNYSSMEISAGKVGELIARLAQYYATWNSQHVHDERSLALVASVIEQKTDDNGKIISSAKAKVLTDATDEAYKANMSRCHVQNIEQYINALKSLLKGITNEFAYQTN